MRCEQVRDLLSPYIDQMTDEKETKLVEAHLAQCKQCRQELDHLKFMCGVLKDLDHALIPERFSEDLHKRLLEEKTGLFVAKEVKRPKRSGWLAAGVAGLALAIGIYASSVLPLGNFVASLQNESDKEQEKPKVAIEDIIRSIKGWNMDDTGEPDLDIAENPEPNNTQQTPVIPNNNVQKNVGEEKPSVDIDKPMPTEPQITDEYTTKIKVPDIGEGVSQVIRVADANNSEYILSPNGTVMQAMSGTVTKEITLKVDKSKSEALLEQLNGIGKVSTPLHNKIELTEEYNALTKKISVTEKEIQKLESKDEFSEADIKLLNDLKADLKASNEQKAELDKELNTVTIKVYLTEEVKP